MERLATAWVRMPDRKDGSVGVSWDGCTPSSETKERTKQRAAFALVRRNMQKKRGRRWRRASRRLAKKAGREARTA